MQKVKNQYIIFLLIAILSMLFDVLVIVGIGSSVCYLIIGACNLISPKKRKANSFFSLSCLAVFTLTLLGGYATTMYIEEDLIHFSQELHGTIPTDKNHLIILGNGRLSWITRKMLLNYVNVDGKAIAQLRIFPYQIGEFDFMKNEIRLRSFD